MRGQLPHLLQLMRLQQLQRQVPLRRVAALPRGRVHEVGCARVAGVLVVLLLLLLLLLLLVLLLAQACHRVPGGQALC